jgi:HPt (histidine-containing phosphotransfer) domain-containing protein
MDAAPAGFRPLILRIFVLYLLVPGRRFIYHAGRLQMADEKGNETIYIDFDEGVKRVMGNTGLYIKILRQFKADTNFADLAANLAAGDMEKARVSAHTLKGLAANLSLIELSTRVRDLEGLIKEGAVQPGAADAIKTVYEETLKKLDEALAQHAS